MSKTLRNAGCWAAADGIAAAFLVPINRQMTGIYGEAETSVPEGRFAACDAGLIAVLAGAATG